MTATLFPTLTRQSAPRRRVADAPEWGPITSGSVLLAIDPSIARCGWALLLKTNRDPTRLSSGIIYPKTRDGLNRFDDLARQLAILSKPVTLNGVDYCATDAVVEIPFGIGEGGRPMLDYARSVGVCEAACTLAGLSMNRVRANAWRSHGRGSGEAKRLTLLAVKASFGGYEPKDLNESDALGIGLWLCNRPTMRGE